MRQAAKGYWVLCCVISLSVLVSRFSLLRMTFAAPQVHSSDQVYDTALLWDRLSPILSLSHSLLLAQEVGATQHQHECWVPPTFSERPLVDTVYGPHDLLNQNSCLLIYKSLCHNNLSKWVPYALPEVTPLDKWKKNFTNFSFHHFPQGAFTAIKVTSSVIFDS